METIACEVNNSDNTRPHSELGRREVWGSILSFKLDIFFPRILGYSYLTWRKQKDHSCQFLLSSFYWVYPLDQGYKYASGSMLFLIARQRESLFLCVPNPSPSFSLRERVFGLMVFPRGNPFLVHFPCCASLLHPFLSKENIV